MKNFLKKHFLNWFTNINLLFITFISISLVCVTYKINNNYISIFIYILAVALMFINIKKTYYLLLVLLLFLIYFLLFYKFNFSHILKLKIYKVIEVKDNYILAKQFKYLFYIPVGEVKCSVGEYINVSGTVQKVVIEKNFWEFNFNEYLWEKNVKYKFISPIVEIKKTKSLQYYLYKLMDRSNNLTKLFLLQQKTHDPIYDNLNCYSLGYLLNLSGFNIYLISNLLNYKIFKRNQIYKKYRIILISFLLYYSYLLNFKIYILKSTILLFLNWLEQNFKFKFSKKSKIALLWIIGLFINPLFLFNIGFIFSFTVSLLYKKFNNKKPITNLFYNYLLFVLLFIPLQLNYFYKLFWFKSLFQIFLIPIISFCFLLSLIFQLSIFNKFMNIIYFLLEGLTEMLNYINLKTICGKPSLIFILIYYALYIFLGKWIFLKKHFKKIFAILFCCNLFLTVQANQFFKYSPSVTMLNVGNGNSFILHYKNKTFLFDAGRGTGFSKDCLHQYLLYTGVRKIDTVFISHNHVDHYDQLDNLKKSYKIKNIYFNYDLKKFYKYKNMKITNFIELKNKDENDNSQVSLIEINNKKLLFTGDSSKFREQRLLQNAFFINKVKNQIDFLQVGHHGSNTSSSDEFIKTLQPKTCFISARNTEKLKFPNPETLKTLLKYQCKIFITNNKNSYRYKLNSGKVFKIEKNSFL